MAIWIQFQRLLNLAQSQRKLRCVEKTPRATQHLPDVRLANGLIHLAAEHGDLDPIPAPPESCAKPAETPMRRKNAARYPAFAGCASGERLDPPGGGAWRSGSNSSAS